MSISPEDTFLGGDDESFDADLSETTVGYVIPDGDYELICTDVKREVAKSGNPMFVWKFQANKAGKNMTFTLYTSLSKAALFKVAETTEALGVGNAGEKVSFKKSQVIGRQVIGVIRKEDYNGNESSKLQRVKPHPKGAIVATDDAPF